MPDRLAGRVPAWVVELGVGLGTTLALSAARLALMPLLGQQAPYAFIFLAVVISAVLAGWRSGLVALVVGQFITLYAVVEPRWTFEVINKESLGALLLSTASQLLILAAIHFYQREVHRASADQDRQMDLLSEALKEIDHRTRNNYQTVVAMILLQAQRASHPEVRQALQDAAERVQAVSLASDQLALRSEDLGTVRLGDHLRELCGQIRRGMTRDGVIRVASTQGPNGLSVIVEDNGAGLQPQPAGSRTGLGTRLVERFISQVGATHQVTTSTSGTVHTILVPSLG